MQQHIKLTSQNQAEMKAFSGFPEGKHHLVRVTNVFFKDLLPLIDDLDELKVTLHIFWKLDQMEGIFRFLKLSDLIVDQDLIKGLKQEKTDNLVKALEQAVKRGTLLEAEISGTSKNETIYFLNSPRGRSALHTLQKGQWDPLLSTSQSYDEVGETPNIYKLYEENIGALTPILADSLKEAENTYPAAWIEEAFHIAVENNKRNWRYINAILERWNREGKHGGKEKSKDRSDSQETRRRYVEGEFSEFIEH